MGTLVTSATKEMVFNTNSLTYSISWRYTWSTLDDLYVQNILYSCQLKKNVGLLDNNQQQMNKNNNKQQLPIKFSYRVLNYLGSCGYYQETDRHEIILAW